jgi:serpin B
MRHLCSLLALSFACAACHPLVAGTSPTRMASVPPTMDMSPAKRLATPSGLVMEPASNDEIKGLARSNNAFGLDLFARIRTKKGNLALSPLSLATALTMAWAGARGETAEQMKNVLHQSGTIDQALHLNRKLLASYQDPALKVTIRIATRLFVEKTYTLKPSYLDITGTTFGAPVEPVDFRQDSDASRLHINAWIAASTQERIKDLFPPQSLDANTRLVLANALYFLGGWSRPFSKQLTAAAPFHLTASESHDAPTMHQADVFGFAATDGVKRLEMFYEGHALAMTLVLPDEVDGLDAVEARLSPALLDAWFGALPGYRVDIALPRFEIDPADSLALVNTLEALGMPFAFNPHKADFTGIASPSLHIDQVFQKAFVKLDEKGTEAVAATAAAGKQRSARAEPPKAEFHADHPFLFFLRDVRSGMILFMGRVSDPTSK